MSSPASTVSIAGTLMRRARFQIVDELEKLAKALDLVADRDTQNAPDNFDSRVVRRS